MADPIRRQVFFSGRVQGVCFRMTTLEIASRYDVVGFVRNLPNGDVELVMEATKPEAEAFVAAIQRAMKGNIDATDVHTLKTTGEFTRFEIR